MRKPPARPATISLQLLCFLGAATGCWSAVLADPPASGRSVLVAPHRLPAVNRLPHSGMVPVVVKAAPDGLRGGTEPELAVRQNYEAQGEAETITPRCRPAAWRAERRPLRVAQQPEADLFPVESPEETADETPDQAPSEEALRPADLYIKPMQQITGDTAAPKGVMPPDYAAAQFPQTATDVGLGTRRGDMQYAYFWEATAFCHGPLYFEEVNLERYGYTFGILQPAASGVHFFSTIPFLPYKMALQRPHECVYSLGYYRPGSCAPFQRQRHEFRAFPAAVETGTVLGLIFIMP